MNKHVIYTAVAVVALVAFAFFNGLPHRSKAGSDPLAGYTLLGIDGGSSELVAHDFNTGESTVIGKIRTSDGTVLTGIEGAAYVPRAANMYAFWTDPDDGLTKLVYINVTTGAAIIVGDGVGKGQVTGAVAAMSTAGSTVETGEKTPLNEVRSYELFALQNPHMEQIEGTLNINPTQNVRSEFFLYTNTGLAVSHSDLHEGAPVDSGGVLFEGKAMGVRIRAKGAGTQTGMSVNGEVYRMSNSDTYIISGSLDVKVYNDNVNSQGKAMGRWHVQVNPSLGTIEQTTPLEFDIKDGQVIPTTDAMVKVTVIGAAISNGLYDLPVTTAATIGDETFTPFGAYAQALAGNVNDGSNPRSHIFSEVFEAESPISMAARSWDKSNSQSSGALESHWQEYLAFDSSDNTPQIKVLRDGDNVPKMEGHEGQASVEEYLADYIDGAAGKVTLSEHQAIFLFELGTTNLTASSADFQDLVVLVTLGDNLDELSDVPTVPEFEGVLGGKLIRVNPGTGASETVMQLTRTYDSLAAVTSNLFYAVSGRDLYVLNPADGSETRVGGLEVSDAAALEFLGGDLYGFSNTVDRLVGVDEASAASLTSLINVKVNDLSSITFARSADIPAGTAFD